MTFNAVTSLPTLTVDLQALRDNFSAFQNKIKPSKVAAVVKADAYGLGMKEVAGALISAGCQTFFVAYLEEGIVLHQHLNTLIQRGGEEGAKASYPHTTTADIYVLEGLQPGQQEKYLSYNLRPVLGTNEAVNLWEREGKNKPCALHIDTGMARTGFEARDIEPLRDQLLSLNLCLIMSHYASSDDPFSPQNKQQKESFDRMSRAFPGVPTCLANSHGVSLGKSYWGDIVRVGLGLSGFVSSADLPLKPAASLTAKIIQLRDLQVGQTVGYNATWRADRPTRLATIGIGYADGLPRCLSNKGCFYWGETPLPIRGSISMDFTTIDVTDVSCHTLEMGKSVAFFYDKATLERQAKLSGTISYEILAQMGPRCRRIYI